LPPFALRAHLPFRKIPGDARVFLLSKRFQQAQMPRLHPVIGPVSAPLRAHL